MNTYVPDFQHRAMAERSTILRCAVGSTLHGLNLDDSDRDEMGVCIEDLAAAIGFAPFEQYVYRSAAEREGLRDAPSQPGDLDLTIYGLRKFLILAMGGNPSVLPLLFAPRLYCQVQDPIGRDLQELAPLILSRHAGRRYLGYLSQQRERMLGIRGGRGVTRPELVEKHGYDTHYGMHMLRLACQGVELLETGRMTLPMRERERAGLLAVRRGEVSQSELLHAVQLAEVRLQALSTASASALGSEPDRDLVESWMRDRYLERWNASTVLPTTQSTNPAAYW